MVRFALSPWVAVLGACCILACQGEPKSGLGESCARTADCMEGASCVKQTCVASDGALAVPKASPAAAGGKVQVQASPAASKASPCAAAKKLAGPWGWTSAVVGGHSKGSIGINGYYLMDVKESDCKLIVDVEKRGYAKKTFSADTIQKGSATFELKAIEGLDGEASGHLNLVSAKGQETEMAITFVFEGDKVWGHWHYRGESWIKSGMWGALKGAKHNAERMKFKSWTDQPCTVQCVMGCEVPRREQEDDMGGVAYQPCLDSCKGKPHGAPKLCQARRTTLAAEDEGFKDRKKGWGWSDRCYKHLKADRLAYAEAACKEGLKVARKLAGEEGMGDVKAAKAMSALHYNLGIVAEKRDLKKRAIKHFKKAGWWNPESKGAHKKLTKHGWKDPCGGDWNQYPCRPFPKCCFE